MNIVTLPSVNFTKKEKGCKAGDKCLFPHHKVDEQPNKKPKKGCYSPKRRESDEEYCCCCENCTIIGLRLAIFGSVGFSKWKAVQGKPDAKSLGTDSKNTIHATSSKYPGKERSIAWKNTSQKSSSAKSLRYEI